MKVIYLKILSYCKYVYQDYLFSIVRRILEICKIESLSHPYAINNYDGEKRFNEKFNENGGFFVEIGGFDGYLNSPTYYLEKFKSWEGILIEPIPNLFYKCQKNRKDSSVICKACVSFDYSNTSVELLNGGHSSQVKENQLGNQDWISNYQLQIPENNRIIFSEAITLSKVLEDYFETNIFREIDVLVLDVEGYELEVLKGLDFDRYRPLEILIESHSNEHFLAVSNFLEIKNYSLESKYSAIDYLFIADGR